MKHWKAIRNFFLNQKLKYKFFFTISIILLLAMLIFFITTVLITSIYVKRASVSNAKQAFELSNTLMEDRLDAINLCSLSLSQEPQMYKIYSSGLDFNNILEVNENIQYIQDYINLTKCTDISKISLYLNTNSSINTELISDLNHAYKTDWFKYMEDNDLSVYWNPNTVNHSSDSEDVYSDISLIRTVRNPIKDYAIMAIIKIDFHKYLLEEVLNKNTEYTDSICYIQNSTGVIYAATDYSLASDFVKSYNSVYSLNYSDDNWANHRVNGRGYHIGFNKINNTDLFIVKALPSWELYSIALTFTPLLFMMMVLILIISYIAAMRLSGSITGRISLLASNLKNIQDGQTIQQIPAIYNDDISIIVNSCNEMIEKINNLIHESFENGQKLKIAEYKILREQINPHFLYNSLNLINCLAFDNDCSKISTVVSSLSNFYKTGLNNGKDEISIKDEFLHIRSYVNIQNMRYMDRIKFIVDVPEEFLNYKIIKTVLQPIVENSISHGILMKLSKSGTVIIKAYTDTDDVSDMIIEVYDDGIGIKPTVLQNILSTDSGGFGLKNTDQRLKLYYGDKYGLSVASIYGENTTVKVKIPKNIYVDDIHWEE